MISKLPCLVPHVPERSLHSPSQQVRCCLSITDLEDAYADYQQTLAALTLQPTNLTLKQHALLHGRTYALLTHLCADPSLRRYDECTLFNDIMAATAMDWSASTPRPHCGDESRRSM